MDTTGGYQSLLGLTSINSNSSTIDILNVENITIDGVIDLSKAIVGGLTTSQIDEGLNLYYTETRVNNNPNVSSNTTHRDRTDNPHSVTAAQVGIHTTDDIIEGHNNLYYTDIRFDDRLATKTTTSLAEGANLYYTEARFDTRLATKSTTNLTEGANLYYTDVRFDNRLLSKTTTDLTEGANLYYTDARFDTRFGTKSTTNLTEGANLYYTDVRFDNRLLSKTTTDLTEGANLYYTDARFDARFGIKTTTNLTEGANLYYTDARFDARFGIKTTTNLTEGTNLYYTDARFDARFGIKTTDDLTEGKNNIYYTETRVSANTDVKANTAYRNTGHLPLAGGTLTGNLNMGNQDIINSNALTIGASTRKINITGGIEITGVGNTADGSHVTCFTTTDNYPIFQNLNFVHNAVYLTFDGYYDFINWKKSHSTATFQISKEYNQLNFNVWNTGAAGSTITGIQTSHAMIIDANKRVKIYNGLDVTGNITVSGTVDGVDVATLNTNTTNHIANTNNPHGVLASQINDFDTEVSANVDVKANTAYTAVGHLPLDGGTLTGDLTGDGELNIGGEKITKGATNGLQLYGPSSNIGGPHIQAFVSTDNYPVFQQLNNYHGSIAMCFDAYADGFTWKSSSTSNAIIYKSNTDLEFSHSSGVAAGGEVTWNAGFSMDLANGLVSFSNGVDVTGDLTISGTVDGVDVAALETDVKANTTYRNTGHLPLSGGTLTGDLTVSGKINIGGAKIARGATNGLQLYGTQQNLSGPHIQAFVSTDTYPTYQMLNWSHNNVNMTFDAYYDGSWRSSSTTSNLLINKASTSVNFMYDSGIALGGAVTFNTGFSMDLTNGLVSCNKGLDVTGDLTVSGTVDGVDLKALETAVSSNTDKVSASGTINTHSDVNITAPADGHLLTYTSGEWKNIAPAGVDGYLPLEGGTLTGDLNINGGLAIGDGKLKGGIRLNGPGRSNDGPHITAYVSDDPYPVFEISNYAHNEATLAFDAYLEDGVWRSGSTASNCLFAKGITSIDMFFSHGIAKGEPMYKQDLLKGFTMNTETGLVICHYGLEVKGDITVSGTVDGVDSSDFLVVDGSRAMTGTLNMGNQDIDNVNQVFVDRSSVANNKIVLYDGGTPSTTAFYGFGIQSATLLYNVDGSSANHKFYYGGTNEVFRIGNSGVYSYRNLDVKGNITVSGTVDGIDIQSLNTTVGGKLSLTGGTMTGNLDMGGYNINTVGTVDGYNLDTLNTNINSKLPLSGGTVSGNLATNGFFTANGGSKLVVQNGIEGSGRGIYMWAGNNQSWGIYMATYGGGKSFSGGTANKRGNVASHAIRFRVHAGTSNGFIWENSNNDIIASLDFYGNFVSNGPYSINSDRRKKENFGETFGLEFINKLKPLSYNMINDKKVRHGLIAQEVEEVLAGYDLKFSGLQAVNVMIPNPECKYKDDPEKCTMLDTGEVEYSLSYSEFIAPLIKAVQELSAEVNTLKNRIEILEKPII